MRPHAAAPVEFTPLFDWSPPRGQKLSLMSFIAASAALHALCFYLFQVIYPPTVALLPPPARVNLITPDSEQGRLLLRWIEAEDPALSSTTQRPSEAAAVPLPNAVHVPSYTDRLPALRMPVLTASVPPIPSAQPPGPVPIARAPQPVPAPVTATAIRFESKSLAAPAMPPLYFTASRDDPPQPAQFRVAISETGDVRYCIIEASSGDGALDTQARQAITLSRFPALKTDDAKAKDALVWTMATVEWGNDVALPSPPPSNTPKP